MKPGYKQTEVGVIPEEWEVSPLRDIVAAVIDNRGKTPPLANDGHPMLEVNSVYGAARNPDFSQVSKFVDQTTYENWFRKGHPKPTDILIATVGTAGASVIIGEELGCIAQNIIGLRISPKHDPSFVFQYTRTELFKGQVRAVLMGAVQPSLKVPHLLAFHCPHPRTESEQRAIATALSDVDGLLGGLDRLIAKKRDLKQAAMQQLLTGQTRLPGFHGEWELKRLGDVGKFLKGSGVTKDQTSSGLLACARYGELYTLHHDVVRRFQSWISPEVAATAVRLKHGDILFAGSGETKEEIGKCAAFVSDIEAYAGGDIVILRPDDSNSVFLGYYLNTGSIAQQKASRGQGDAVVHISSTALSDIRCKLPPHAEQTAIATVLSEMDGELALLEQRREKTRALKQAMMQELLLGKTRLN